MRVWSVCAFVLVSLAGAGSVMAQSSGQPSGQPASTTQDQRFDLGQIVVVGTEGSRPGVGGALLEAEQMWIFDRNSLDQAVNVIPGVSSQFDSNGRRNESDIFVRGFGRWQVPLMLDGVRIYLPADNRLDFARFLTADIAAVQVQKGYASVIDGPGAMGGAINLVSRKPVKPFEFEASGSIGGRSDNEGWNGYVMAGTRQDKFYLQGSANVADRDYWTLSDNYAPAANSLQPKGQRQSSDSSDARYNVKAGFTPNSTDEYTINYINQQGEKGAPINIYNNPPVPPNSYWRWPYWDIQNTSLLTRTQVGANSYVKGKLYYNQFKNGLDAFDDNTYTTQSANGRFRSPYDDHAYGGGLEFGNTRPNANTIKASFYYRTDFHTEQQINRPTHPTLSTTEPLQEQSQRTWSIAAEDTFHVSPRFDIVGGVSYDNYQITKAEEYNTTRGVFEYPKGGADAFNWQSALIWKYNGSGQVHASVSDRARFPVIFELYSTRFGTATPNPDLGPERATNYELGWRGAASKNSTFEAAVFYSNVRDLIQTVVLPDTTSQTQNVGDGNFLGAEFAAEVSPVEQLRIGANYTVMDRTVRDALLPTLRPTGVPKHKAFFFASWRPVNKLSITPSFDMASDRWSDVNTTPAAAFPYVRTGAYKLLNVQAQYEITSKFDVMAGFRNLTDDYYELSWGLPQAGRTFFLKTRIGY